MKILSVNFSLFANKTQYNHVKYFKNPFLKQNYDTFTFMGKKGAKHFSEDEKQEQKEKIRFILQEAIEKHEVMTGSMLAQKTGIALHNINKRFLEDENLYYLWQRVKSVDNVKYSDQEKELFIQKIGEILENALITNSKISMRELDAKLGVSKSIYTEIIEGNEHYKELYEKVRKGKPLKIRTKEEKLLEEQQIKQCLLNLSKSGQRKTDKECAKELQMTQSYFKKRINENPELKAMYEQIQNPPKKKFEGGFEGKKEEVRLLLRQYAQKNKKIKAKDFIKQADISYETLRKMVKSDEEIASLWKQIQTETHAKYSRQDIETVDNYIHRYLTLKAEKGEKTTFEEIAKYYNLSPEFVYKRLSENPSLNYRWNKVKSKNNHYYDKDDKEMQTEQIIEILKEAVRLDIKVTMQELSIMTKLSQSVIRNRINSNPRAAKWWEKNKNIGKNST